MSTLTIAVAGSTGTVGHHVVDVASTRGHRVVPLARSAGVDLLSGSDLAPTLAGVDCVVDVTSVATRKSKESREFFGTVTEHLLAAEQAAGVGHHLALSVVGCDTAPDGYYAGKVLQEQLVAASPVPWTILRATQFHEFVGQVFGAVSAGPLVLVPRMLSQPVAALEVAQRLVDLAEAGPSGRVRDFGGPRTERLPDMVRDWARGTRRRGRVVPVPLPGTLGRAMRDGSLLAGADADRGHQTFAEWLAGQAATAPSGVSGGARRRTPG